MISSISDLKFVLIVQSVIHAVDAVLTPPTMIKTLGYANNFASISVEIIHELLVASGWEANDLSISVEGANSNRFTLFAPLDEAFDELLFMPAFRERLVKPDWSRHLELFLNNLLSPAPLSADFLYSQPETVVTSVGNETITITKTDTLSIGAGSLFLDLNPSCVDG
jgi:uncharacterized surface protein with fasciclin (FAS1) repeats